MLILALFWKTGSAVSSSAAPRISFEITHVCRADELTTFPVKCFRVFVFLAATKCQSTYPIYRPAYRPPLVARPSRRECDRCYPQRHLATELKNIHGFRKKQSITPNKGLFQSILNNFFTEIKQYTYQVKKRNSFSWETFFNLPPNVLNYLIIENPFAQTSAASHFLMEWK